MSWWNPDIVGKMTRTPMNISVVNENINNYLDYENMSNKIKFPRKKKKKKKEGITLVSIIYVKYHISIHCEN